MKKHIRSAMSVFAALFMTLSLFASVSGIAFAAAKSVTINKENFPNKNFREYVRKFDLNGNGKLAASEIAKVRKINVSGQKITTLKGVEYFTELTSLKCRNNELKKLDVSKNTKLKTLNCKGNNLTKLDVRKNTKLTSLTNDKGVTVAKAAKSAVPVRSVWDSNCDGTTMYQVLYPDTIVRHASWPVKKYITHPDFFYGGDLEKINATVAPFTFIIVGRNAGAVCKVKSLLADGAIVLSNSSASFNRNWRGEGAASWSGYVKKSGLKEGQKILEISIDNKYTLYGRYYKSGIKFK